MNTGRIDFNKVCKDYGIRICSYEDAPQAVKKLGLNRASTTGIAFRTLDGTPAILFKEGRPSAETRFTIAHELGHILLGHLDYRRSFDEQYPGFAESEANYFAVALLTHDLISQYGQAD